MGSLTPAAIGGRVYFRLSDLPVAVREKGAHAYANEASRIFDPIDALIESAKVWRAATDPNGRVFNVSEKAWLRVMKVLP